MKSFLFKSVIQPLLAVSFFLLFGGGFVYVGFADVHVEGKKVRSGTTLDITNSHFWGLMKSSHHMEAVRSVSIETRQSTSRSNGRQRTTTVSEVVITSATEEYGLFGGYSNVDNELKQEAKSKLSAFLSSDTAETLKTDFHIANLFGYVGMPFFAIGVIGLVGMPFSVIRAMRQP